MHVAQRFEQLIDTYRHPDGSRWTGQQLDEATSRIESPSYEKMLAIAKAMGFPPKAWFEDMPGDVARSAPGGGLAPRVEHLFETIVHPRTGEPYTDVEVARMSLGDLTDEDVEGMRIGRIADPAVSKVAALATVFGVPPSYLVDRGTDPAILDEETLATLSSETADAILRKSSRLPQREKQIVLGIVRGFARPAE